MMRAESKVALVSTWWRVIVCINRVRILGGGQQWPTSLFLLPTDVATLQPPTDVAQARHPTVRTSIQPHLSATVYDGSPVHHDLKPSGSSDFAYTYQGKDFRDARDHLVEGVMLKSNSGKRSLFVVSFGENWCLGV